MSLAHGRRPRSLLALLLMALFAFATDAAARNVIEGFSKAPTFTPPRGCVPKQETYGVVSRCEQTIEPGRAFIVLIDVAAGAFADSETFARDQASEIEGYWKEAYPGKVTFSSKPSAIVPGNAPQGTRCYEYAITAETAQTIDQQSVPTLSHVAGLTCAWPVENPAPGKWTIEIFWLEAYDEYAPSRGQKPMPAFDATVRDLFASARL